jgi:hypothetical protein
MGILFKKQTLSKEKCAFMARFSFNNLEPTNHSIVHPNFHQLKI